MQNKLETPIGTKESKKLEAKKVGVIDVIVEMQKDRDKKDVGEKVVLTCKHPDKEEYIKISSVIFIKNKEIKNSGLWYQPDEDKLISKDSALASMLRFYACSSLSGLIGKEVSTDLDDKGYLSVKAY